MSAFDKGNSNDTTSKVSEPDISEKLYATGLATERNQPLATTGDTLKPPGQTPPGESIPTLVLVDSLQEGDLPKASVQPGLITGGITLGTKAISPGRKNGNSEPPTRERKEAQPGGAIGGALADHGGRSPKDLQQTFPGKKTGQNDNGRGGKPDPAAQQELGHQNARDGKASLAPESEKSRQLQEQDRLTREHEELRTMMGVLDGGHLQGVMDLKNRPIDPLNFPELVNRVREIEQRTALAKQHYDKIIEGVETSPLKGSRIHLDLLANRLLLSQETGNLALASKDAKAVAELTKSGAPHKYADQESLRRLIQKCYSDKN